MKTKVKKTGEIVDVEYWYQESDTREFIYKEDSSERSWSEGELEFVYENEKLFRSMNVYKIRYYDNDYVTILSAESSDRAIELYCELEDVHPSNIYATYIPEVHADRELVIYSDILND